MQYDNRIKDFINRNDENLKYIEKERSQNNVEC